MSHFWLNATECKKHINSNFTISQEERNLERLTRKKDRKPSVCVWIGVCVCMCMRVCSCECVHVCAFLFPFLLRVCVCVAILWSTNTNTYTHTHKQTHTWHVQNRACTQTHTHTHTNKHTHTHTHNHNKRSPFANRNAAVEFLFCGKKCFSTLCEHSLREQSEKKGGQEREIEMRRDLYLRHLCDSVLTNLYIYKYIHTRTHMGENARWREKFMYIVLSFHTHEPVYIYTHIHLCVCVYIHICI